MNGWPLLYVPEIPAGYSIPELRLLNTATKEIETIPQKSEYRLYVCGITPYDATHLGHAATYLVFDLIHRYLRATGARVRFVQNITDIDDPLLERAARDSITWEELAQSQIDLFRGDMTDLHILPPDFYMGVVESMSLIISAVQKLIDAGHTYKVNGDIYFRVHSDPDFGTRSKLSHDQMMEIFRERGGDPDRVGKENPLDALVWLAQRPGEPGWESPFGIGRPGWHIECSAIALNFLQSSSDDEYSIDIQGGGSDLIFPHHEMSASQSFSITGKPFSRFYVHAGMVGLDGQKMSKSLGNLVFVSKIISSGFEPMAIRWALMKHSYDQDVMWHHSMIESAAAEIEELRECLSRVDVAPTESVISALISSLSNNLDTAHVVKELKLWIQETKSGKTGGHAGELSRAIDSLLGLAL
ncbi:MAG: cysteine--1-D-myo-inosityl 2-amino-2-deoxy-alpha-D-glucopyranoside ligase [Actinobacteria bacterium]|uniref:L-cysteine:1D-myo-inositol 2-amino-2-deoxy-alpha-D-glucopyranoside ligase n=1 Tax=freshwater metagenome TaxID=449393 RepID=A0A6J5YR31_9ZZZZ|nr:cysteine--1-D-myo-inosityl 2-amino-2-deoxy-alpha-D-glucopyranoside ligase [Actinomycetota bacterium]